MNARIAAVLLLALGLRAAAWWLVLPTEPVLDERDYFGRASRMVRGAEIERESARPPGCIAYYAAAMRVFGDRHEVARAANVVASAFLPFLVWLLGRRVAGERTAWIAALAVAAYPDLIFYGCGLWSEPLYHVLSVGALLLLLDAAGRRDSAAPVIGAGLLLGLAALTREVAVPFAAAAGAWLVLRRGIRARRGWGEAALLGAACLLTLLPWSARQTRDRGFPVLITTTNWQNLYVGNIPPDLKRAEGAPERPILALNFQGFRKLGDDPDARADSARIVVKQRIAEEMPGWPFRKTAEMLPRIVTPNSLPTARLMARPDGTGWQRTHAYVSRLDGTRAEGLRDVIAWLNVASWAVLLLGGVAGLALGRGSPAFALIAIFAAAHLAPQILAYGESRYRMPLVPLLALGLALLLTRGPEAWRGAGTVRRAATVTAVGIVAWAAGSFWWTLTSPRWG